MEKKYVYYSEPYKNTLIDALDRIENKVTRRFKLLFFMLLTIFVVSAATYLLNKNRELNNAVKNKINTTQTIK
jgi:hypothetical protein